MKYLANPIFATLSNFFGGIWNVIYAVFSIFFIKWKITISLFFMAVFLAGAITESIQEKNAYPLLKQAGGKILSADEDMYYEMIKIENNDFRIPTTLIKQGDQGFWHDIKSIASKTNFTFKIFGTIWFLYIFTHLWSLIYKLHNENESFWNIIFAILTVIILQMGYSLALLYINAETLPSQEQRIEDVSFSLIPLKGTLFSQHSVAYHLFITGNLIETFKKSAAPLTQPIQNLSQTNETTINLNTTS